MTIDKERERCATLAAAWPTAPYAGTPEQRLALQRAFLDIAQAIRAGLPSVPTVGGHEEAADAGPGGVSDSS